MIKYFRQAFSITNSNIILTTPFILFLLVIGIFIGVTGGMLNSRLSAIFLLLTLLFMTSAFVAGWMFLIRKTIDTYKENLSQEENAKKTLPVMNTMTSGIGEYFVPVVIGSILFFGLVILFMLAGKFIGSHIIGALNVPFDSLRSSMMSNEQMTEFLKSLPVDELKKMSQWNLLILALVSIFSFITMFWPSALIYTDKNPLFALLKSIKFLFKNFLNSIVLFIYISIINFLITTLNGLYAGNNILYFISILIYFYFVVYIIVLVFLYYDSEQQEKIEDNCDCRTDSIGEN